MAWPCAISVGSLDEAAVAALSIDDSMRSWKQQANSARRNCADSIRGTGIRQHFRLVALGLLKSHKSGCVEQLRAPPSRNYQHSFAMPKITYIEFNGTKHQADVPVGTSVMRGAVDNLIPGIDADCGGACACATCHVYVQPEWFDKLEPKNTMEEDMLGFAAVTQEYSRLACQLTVSEAMDGLVVSMPEGQH